MRIRLSVMLTLLFLVFGSFILPNGQSNISTDQSYDGFYLEGEEIVGYNVTHLLYDNTENNLIINAFNDSDDEVSAILSEYDIFAFNTNDTFPDWETTNDMLGLQLGFEGGHNGVHTPFGYTTPWTTNPDEVPLDGPPALLWPIIPFGDATYYSTLKTDFEGLGYTVDNSNSETFEVSYSNDTYSAVVLYDKSTGLMQKYSYDGVTNGEDGVVPLEFDLEYTFDLSPSNSGTFEFYSTNPLLDYEVTEAQNGTTNSFNLDFSSEKAIDSGGEGNVVVGDKLSLDKFDNVNSDPTSGEGVGYEFRLLDRETDNYLYMNTSIELPETNPEENGFFLYPLFPVIDTELMEGYMGVTDVVSDYYRYEITEDFVTLEFNSPSFSILASWDLDSGVLENWYFEDITNDLILHLEIITFNDQNAFDLDWGVSSGDTIDLHFSELDIGGNSSLQLEEGSGEIQEGDNVTLTIDEAVIEDGPLFFADLDGPHGSEEGIRFTQPYPGYFIADGPPLFTPAILTGNAEFYQWMDDLYYETGADFAKGDKIELNWTDTTDGETFDIDIVWDKPTGILQYYSLDYTPSSSSDDVALQMVVETISSSVDASPDSEDDTDIEDSAPSLAYSITPITLISSFMIATFIYRRKKSKINV